MRTNPDVSGAADGSRALRWLIRRSTPPISSPFVLKHKVIAMSREETRREIIRRFCDGVGGRPRLEHVGTRLPWAVYQRLDSFAVSHRMSRSEALRRLVERGLPS